MRKSALPDLKVVSSLPAIVEKKPHPLKGRKPPMAGIGRKKGAQNVLTRVIKEAVVDAAAQIGEDGKGRNGLQGYLKRLALHEPRSFATLLGRIIPIQIQGDPDAPFRVTISSEDARIG